MTKRNRTGAGSSSLTGASSPAPAGRESLSRRPKRPRLTDSKPLVGQIECLPMQEMRAAPGDIINQVQMGKVYVITKQGSPVAVLSALPGDRLAINIDGKGHVTYGLE